MKNLIFISKAFIIACFLLFAQRSIASHILGGDISYQQTSGNTYQITLTLFRDCNGLALPTSLNVDIKSQSLSYSQAMTLTQTSTTNISNVCASAASVCNGGSYPGAEKCVYQGNFTLPQASRDWKFSYTDCCRSGTISSLVQPSSANFYIESMLNNVDFGGNNSAVFYRDPMLTMQTQQPFSHNDNAQDWIDSDSLVYELVPVSTASGQTAAYNLGYTATKPFSVVTGSNTFSTTTGQINFTPNSLMTSVLVMRVSDYRNGILRGYVTRDMQYSVTPSTTNNTPTWSSVANVSGATYNAATGVFKMCEGSTVSFSITATDANTANVLAMSSSLPNNASILTNGINPITVTFTWTATTSDVGNHSFSFSASDDACPLKALATIGFVLEVIAPSVSLSFTNVNNPSCFGMNNGTITAVGSGGTPPYVYSGGISWSPQGVFTQLASGTYTVSVSDAVGCSSSASTMLIEPTPLSATMFVTPSDCSNLTGAITAIATGGVSPYTYIWTDGSTTPTPTTLITGIYTITITDANGCTTTGSTGINVLASCVYPGDANNDGIADNTDLLPIALSNALTGNTRPNATTQWVGQTSQDWSANIINTTVNLKHADCNGNGTIEASDTLAILANYGQTHQRPAAAMVFHHNAPTINCTFPTDTLQSAVYPYTLQSSIMVGDAINPATDITGIAFTINYDGTLASSAYMLLSSLSWLGAPNELYHLQHDDGQGHLAVAISRIDGTTRNGQGQIATCSFVIEDNVIGRGTAVNYSFNVNVSDIKAINNQNIVKTVNGGSTHIIIKNVILSTTPSDFAAAVRVFPNPLQSNTLQIKAENVRCTNVALYNTLGQLVLNHQAASDMTTVQIPDLPNGIYTLTLTVEGANGDSEKVLKKIIISR
ncbi:MAG: hypothetical protein RI894_1683 [Bacteroidota bacterium]